MRADVVIAPAALVENIFTGLTPQILTALQAAKLTATQQAQVQKIVQQAHDNLIAAPNPLR